MSGGALIQSCLSFGEFLQGVVLLSSIVFFAVRRSPCRRGFPAVLVQKFEISDLQLARALIFPWFWGIVATLDYGESAS